MVKIVGTRKLSDSYLINLPCFCADFPRGVKISLHSSLSTFNSSSHYSIPESSNLSFYSLVSSYAFYRTSIHYFLERHI